MQTDKFLAGAGVLALFGLAIDLWTRGGGSLYGRFFLWLVAVSS